MIKKWGNSNIYIAIYEIYNYIKYKAQGDVSAYISRSVIASNSKLRADYSIYRIVGSYYINEIEDNKIIKSTYSCQELNKNIEKYRTALNRFNAYIFFLWIN